MEYACILREQVSHRLHIQHRIGEYESPGISETLHALLSKRAVHFEVTWRDFSIVSEYISYGGVHVAENHPGCALCWQCIAEAEECPIC